MSDLEPRYAAAERSDTMDLSRSARLTRHDRRARSPLRASATSFRSSSRAAGLRQLRLSLYRLPSGRSESQICVRRGEALQPEARQVRGVGSGCGLDRDGGRNQALVPSTEAKQPDPVVRSLPEASLEVVPSDRSAGFGRVYRLLLRKYLNRANQSGWRSGPEERSPRSRNPALRKSLQWRWAMHVRTTVRASHGASIPPVGDD